MDSKLDSVGVWLAVATVLEAAAAIIVGLLEDSQRLWALLPGGLGIAALFWALSLFNAHKMSSSSARVAAGPSAPPASSSRSAESLEAERERRYGANRGLFLVHTWRPSDQEGQAVDVKVQLVQHGPGPLKVGTVKSVTYTFGPPRSPGA